MSVFDDDDDDAEEFLKKSFPIIYRVAPPVLTGWQKFFDSKFEEAFGENEREELQYARKIFDRLQKEITPRGIIAFINEMVSLRLAVEEEILLRYIAVFVLAKKQILAEPVSQILNREYLAGVEPIFADDENLSDNIAALAYHVPLTSASQVTLTREIQNSLRSANGVRLKELSLHQHFINILEEVIAQDDFEINNAVAAINALEDYDPDVIPSERITGIWDELCAKETGGSLSGQKFTRTHGLLLAKSSSERCLSLTKYLVKEIRQAEKFSGSMYYHALSSLDECVQENHLDIDLLSLISPLKKAPEIFQDYVKAAQNEYKKSLVSQR